MATISNYKKHLKLSERIKIEKYLNDGMSFRSISRDINKGVNTISRKIVNRRYKEKENLSIILDKVILKGRVCSSLLV